MTVQEASHHIFSQLQPVAGNGEASAMSEWILEYFTGQKKSERLADKNAELSTVQLTQLDEYIARLQKNEPLQYVLNESWFCGLKFYVDNNVLIPRPETEELVEWVITNCRFPIRELSILDIGTGSGCIAIALKRKLRKAQVWSCDISEKALEVGRKNALALGVDVNFRQLNFLNKTHRDKLPFFDIIVSNPPYIPENNKSGMAANVLNYEPATALFVPNNDALIFYKAISEFGKTHLSRKGSIYVEMHEDLSNDTTAVFESANFQIEKKRDMQGKERMLRAWE